MQIQSETNLRHLLDTNIYSLLISATKMDDFVPIAQLKMKGFTLREKCLNTELYLVRILLYSVRIQENIDQT